MTRAIFAGLGAALLMLACALSAFLWTATDADGYLAAQDGLGVDAGVSREVMAEYDRMMAEYLAGDESALDGATLFHEREIAHMRDVYRLFAAARAVRWGALASGGLLALAAVLRDARWKRTLARAAGVGCALFFAPFLALAVWAAADFTGAFEWMHRALFSNDLWQLDPDTDLMIRMLPERFFMELAGKLAGLSLLAALAPPAALLALAGHVRLEGPQVRGLFAPGREDDRDIAREARRRKGK